ncbi:hypothetical protein N7462_005734 [Penicillium macrosclerotiorum]|uniref:uncharacterized protein n=1 Tax=Penicillium macrosclerotiorum TaxID=303699 RepID=UPI0025484417|nr:uncharacterized protein N7462_005734 [Penicillium macrosclerotiorum]KAJ5682569.1 hypothetical protein N7462_005734 [Penicillium macrosclerotiorum]
MSIPSNLVNDLDSLIAFTKDAICNPFAKEEFAKAALMFDNLRMGGKHFGGKLDDARAWTNLLLPRFVQEFPTVVIEKQATLNDPYGWTTRENRQFERDPSKANLKREKIHLNGSIFKEMVAAAGSDTMKYFFNTFTMEITMIHEVAHVFFSQLAEGSDTPLGMGPSSAGMGEGGAHLEINLIGAILDRPPRQAGRPLSTGEVGLTDVNGNYWRIDDQLIKDFCQGKYNWKLIQKTVQSPPTYTPGAASSQPATTGGKPKVKATNSNIERHTVRLTKYSGKNRFIYQAPLHLVFDRDQ